MASGRDPISVHRSLLRFVYTSLADQVPLTVNPSDPDGPLIDGDPVPWDVQPVRKEPQTRPLVVAQPLNANPSRGTAYVREYAQPYEVVAYPLGVPGDPYRSRSFAQGVLQTLYRAIDSGNGLTGHDRSYSMRVPLFDYSETGLDEALPDGQAPIDFLVLQNLDGQVRQDPEQDDLYTVLIDLVVNWRDDGDLSRYEGAVLESIPLGYRAPEDGG